MGKLPIRPDTGFLWLPTFNQSLNTKIFYSLLWWKENALSYPNLVKVAIKYFGTPPSSVYSERLFSSAGIVFEERRNKLLPEKGEHLFIQKNLGLLNLHY